MADREPGADARRLLAVSHALAAGVALFILTGRVLAAAPDAPARPVQLEPVVVAATRTALTDAPPPASSTVLDGAEITTSANVPVDDILRTIPGFSLYLRSSSMVTSPDVDPEAQGVTLRGIGPSGASRALVLVDGVPLIDPFDGQVFWGKIAPDSIDHIEIVRGSSSNLWGNYAMAGVINIVTRPLADNAVSAKASYGTRGLTDDSLAISGRRGPWSLGVDVNFFDLVGFPIVASSQRGPIDDNAGSRHELVNAHARYELPSGAALALHGRFFDEDHDNGTPLRTSATTAGLLDLTGTARTDDGSEWQAMLFSNLQAFNIQFTETDASRTTEHRTDYQKVPFTDVAGSLVWSRRVIEPVLVTAGLDLHWIDGQSRDSFYDEQGVDIEERQRSDGKQIFSGVFLQTIYTPAPEWEVALGNRIDFWQNYDGSQTIAPDTGPATTTHFSSRNQTAVNPRLSVRYRPAEWLAVDAAAYRGFRAPTLAELYRQTEVEDLTLLPNSGLSAERLNGAELGCDLPLLATLDARATGFWSEVNDPITNVDVPGAPLGPEGEATLRRRTNLGLARTVGTEVEVLYDVLRSVQVSGSYLFADAILVRAGGDPDLEGNHLAQIPVHTFTLRTRYQDPRWFNFMLEGRFVDQQFEDAENRESLGSFFVLNGSLTRRLPGIDGEVFIAAENLLDREYAVDRGGGILKVGTPLLGHGGVRLRF